jgi:3-phosphoshikimate 1-carboxyvinyltransferase
MSFGVLGGATGGDISIDDPACVDVSFPGFWSTLASLGATS